MAAAAVATLPAITWALLLCFLMRATASATRSLWPWAVSTMIRSHSASSSASVRSKPVSPTVVAAATRRRPASSLVALGWFTARTMSFMVIRPMQWPSSSTTISFSMRRLCSRRRHSDSVTPGRTVTRLSFVISSAIGCASFSAKRRSRLVTMPTRRPGAPPGPTFSTTGKPEMPWLAISARASASV